MFIYIWGKTLDWQWNNVSQIIFYSISANDSYAVFYNWFICKVYYMSILKYRLRHLPPDVIYQLSYAHNYRKYRFLEFFVKIIFGENSYPKFINMICKCISIQTNTLRLRTCWFIHYIRSLHTTRIFIWISVP